MISTAHKLLTLQNAVKDATEKFHATLTAKKGFEVSAKNLAFTLTEICRKADNIANAAITTAIKLIPAAQADEVAMVALVTDNAIRSFFWDASHAFSDVLEKTMATITTKRVKNAVRALGDELENFAKFTNITENARSEYLHTHNDLFTQVNGHTPTITVAGSPQKLLAAYLQKAVVDTTTEATTEIDLLVEAIQKTNAERVTTDNRISDLNIERDNAYNTYMANKTDTTRLTWYHVHGKLSDAEAQKVVIDKANRKAITACRDILTKMLTAKEIDVDVTTPVSDVDVKALDTDDSQTSAAAQKVSPDADAQVTDDDQAIAFELQALLNIASDCSQAATTAQEADDATYEGHNNYDLGASVVGNIDTEASLAGASGSGVNDYCSAT